MFYIIALSVILVDQLTKVLTLKYIALGQSISLLPFLSIAHTRNAGAAFGLLQGQRWFLVLVGLIVLVTIIVYRIRHHKIHKLFDCGLAFLIGGDIGNLIDRIYYGRVTDFIDVPHWPTFNIADTCINIGVFLIIFYFYKYDKPDKINSKS